MNISCSRTERINQGYRHGVPTTEDSVVTLAALYVTPEYWVEGVGTALLDVVEQSSRQRGTTGVSLRICPENDVGMSFNRKHGYEVVDQRETELFGKTVLERILTATVE